MAKINLRAYHSEIERLIEIGRTREAIAHCKYILSSFPRCVNTYRLLGKALLESQRLGDAADVFQRVLSSVPDDFLSHVGMSIIREDEGNLDEAIWHMQRAFEVQPANSTIQDELRRLIGKRDGMEPPKIRLNRSALARMYIKGNLLDQAITEIQHALAEDPQRLDLKALLAQVYHKKGMEIDAAHAASEVLRKLPNCMVAHCVLAEVLKDSERHDESLKYHQRLIRLDPYFAFLTKDQVDSSQVPDQAVTIEKLEWEEESLPSDEEQPAWATSLGIDLHESEEEELPDWLEGLDTEEKPIAESTPSAESEVIPDWFESEISAAAEETKPEEETPEPQEPAEAEIPSWMSDAGWQPRETAEESPSTEAFTDTEDHPLGETDIEEGELPEWLKDLAPDVDLSKDDEEKAGHEKVEDSEFPAWLEEITEEPPTDQGETFSDEIIGESESIPEWISEEAISEESIPEEHKTLLSETPEEMARTDEEIPTTRRDEEENFLTAKELDETSSTDQEVSFPAETFEAEEKSGEVEIPEWLFEEEEETSYQPQAQDELPEWIEDEFEPSLGDTQPSSKSIPQEEMEADGEISIGNGALENEVLPETSVESTAGQREVSTFSPTIDDEDEAFAWLESLAVKQGAEEALLLDEDKRREEPPDWVQQASKAEPESEEQQQEEEPVRSEKDILEALEEEKLTTPEIISVMDESKTSDTGEETLLEEATPSEFESIDEGIQEITEEVSEKPEAFFSGEEEDIQEQEPQADNLSEEYPIMEKGAISAQEDLQSEEVRQTEIPSWLVEETQTQVEETSWETPIETEITPLDLNQATLAQLERIPGVGFIKAQEIVSYREANGPFSQVDDLLALPSFNQEVLDIIRAYIFVDIVKDEEKPTVTESASIEEETPVIPQDVPAELDSARQKAAQGLLEEAITEYSDLIRQDLALEQIIEDLKALSQSNPQNISLWQNLGDAYMRADQLDDALEAFKKAEDLL